jgi:pimeloyl-ACP methyl ester carboxylesterase
VSRSVRCPSAERKRTVERVARQVESSQPVGEDQVAELERRIPAADVTTVDTGHNVQEEDPVGLAELLDGLLRD